MENKGNDVPNYMSIKVSKELYDRIADVADERKVSMIDVIVEAVASQLGCPPEWGQVPRKTRSGRPRTKHPAAS